MKRRILIKSTKSTEASEIKVINAAKEEILEILENSTDCGATIRILNIQFDCIETEEIFEKNLLYNGLGKVFY